MKRKRVDQVERRRPRVELNLIEEAKTRSAAASKGCSALIARFTGGALLLLLVRLGLG